jgi:hypothetical protein
MMTNIMAPPEESCRYPSYQLSFFAPHHDPSSEMGFEPPRQSSSTLDWDSSNLQATSACAAVLQDDHFCNYGSSSSSSATQYSWAKALLLDCARAIAEKDAPRVQSIMWILNESASPYGDADQRLVSYFVQALFCKISGTGARRHRSLTAAAEKTYCFESMRNMILEFQVATLHLQRDITKTGALVLILLIFSEQNVLLIEMRQFHSLIFESVLDFCHIHFLSLYSVLLESPVSTKSTKQIVKIVFLGGRIEPPSLKITQMSHFNEKHV